MRNRLKWRRLLADLGPAAVLCAAATHELLYNHASPPVWVAAQLSVGLVVLRRLAPEPVLVVTSVLAVAEWAAGSLSVAQLSVLVALHEVARTRDRPRALVAAAIVEAGVVAAAVLFAPTGSVSDAVVLLSGLVLTSLLLGTTQRSQQLYLVALEARARTLQRERQHLADLAVSQERTRLSREIHDIVAHSVSVMVAMAEGAAAVGDADRARDSMRLVAATGRNALDELRHVLRVLREPDAVTPPPVHDVAQLERLFDDVRATGRELVVHVDESAGRLSPALQTTVFRIVQESLTNVVKHAPDATAIDVVVTVEGRRVTVTVADDGPLGAGPEPSGGSGIAGMRERAEFFGGVLSAGPAGHGWCTSASLVDRQETAVVTA